MKTGRYEVKRVSEALGKATHADSVGVEYTEIYPIGAIEFALSDDERYAIPQVEFERNHGWHVLEARARFSTKARKERMMVDFYLYFYDGITEDKVEELKKKIKKAVKTSCITSKIVANNETVGIAVTISKKLNKF